MQYPYRRKKMPGCLLSLFGEGGGGVLYTLSNPRLFCLSFFEKLT